MHDTCERPPWRRLVAIAIAVVPLLAGVWPGPARAQDASSGAGTVDGVLEGLQLKGRTAPAAPFVVQSRPKGDRDFIPVHTPHPERSVKIRTPAEVAATEAELDALRVRQQQRAGQKPGVVPLKQPGTPHGGKKTPR